MLYQFDASALQSFYASEHMHAELDLIWLAQQKLLSETEFQSASSKLESLPKDLANIHPDDKQTNEQGAQRLAI